MLLKQRAKFRSPKNITQEGGIANNSGKHRLFCSPLPQPRRLFLSLDGYGAEISFVSAATEGTSHFECQPGHAGANDGPETVRLCRQVVLPPVLLIELNHLKHRGDQSSGGFNLVSVLSWLGSH